MIRDCINCGRKTILARYIDNAMVLMDGEPRPGGMAVLKGDLNDQPTALFGIETAEDAKFFGLTSDAPRYNKHVCPREEQ